MITISQKEQITQALNDYTKLHDISGNEVARRTNINESYISSIINGKTTVAKSEIKDKWYLLLADFLGVKLQKEYWKPNTGLPILEGPAPSW